MVRVTGEKSIEFLRNERGFIVIVNPNYPLKTDKSVIPVQCQICGTCMLRKVKEVKKVKKLLVVDGLSVPEPNVYCRVCTGNYDHFYQLESILLDMSPELIAQFNGDLQEYINQHQLTADVLINRMRIKFSIAEEDDKSDDDTDESTADDDTDDDTALTNQLEVLTIKDEPISESIPKSKYKTKPAPKAASMWPKKTKAAPVQQVVVPKALSNQVDETAFIPLVDVPAERRIQIEKVCKGCNAVCSKVAHVKQTGRITLNVQCEKCNTIWMAIYEDGHKIGIDCPSCTQRKKTKYQRIIMTILESLLRFLLESIICIPGEEKHLLQLDGVNFDEGFACECNGPQHYRYDPFFHNNDPANFIRQQRNDKIKVDWCKTNSIDLIVVPYFIMKKGIHAIKTFIVNHPAVQACMKRNSIPMPDAAWFNEEVDINVDDENLIPKLSTFLKEKYPHLAVVYPETPVFTTSQKFLLRCSSINHPDEVCEFETDMATMMYFPQSITGTQAIKNQCRLCTPAHVKKGKNYNAAVKKILKETFDEKYIASCIMEKADKALADVKTAAKTAGTKVDDTIIAATKKAKVDFDAASISKVELADPNVVISDTYAEFDLICTCPEKHAEPCRYKSSMESMWIRPNSRTKKYIPRRCCPGCYKKSGIPKAEQSKSKQKVRKMKKDEVI